MLVHYILVTQRYLMELRLTQFLQIYSFFAYCLYSRPLVTSGELVPGLPPAIPKSMDV